MRIFSLCVSIFLFVFCTQTFAAEVLTVKLDKLHILRLSKPGVTVVVADPTIADIRAENPKLFFIFGRANGETNLVILDKKGREIANYELIVTPETARHVTVNRGVDAQTTLSCADRCTVVETVGQVAAPAPPAAAPATPAAPAAGAAATEGGAAATAAAGATGG
jgi:Flp pilus assembly secretin CpaC